MSKTILEFEKPIIELELKIEELRQYSDNLDIADEIKDLELKVQSLKESIYSSLTRWQRVQLARHPDRPYSLDYINLITTNFIELHGDRCYADDKALIGGFASIEGHSVLILGQQKGRDTKSNIFRNFGMMGPEGYRKAYRLMKLAEKFSIPIVTFVDTPGAFPGLGAEERGQAEAIARNLFEMSRLRTPIIVIIIGEGASGGALGIGIGDRVLMMENTWYAVISPESCSSILWRSWDFKEQAAEALKLTANDLLEQGIVDMIISEPFGGAHKSKEAMANILKNIIIEELDSLLKLDKHELIKRRMNKLAGMGFYSE